MQLRKFLVPQFSFLPRIGIHLSYSHEKWRMNTSLTPSIHNWRSMSMMPNVPLSFPPSKFSSTKLSPETTSLSLKITLPFHKLEMSNYLTPRNRLLCIILWRSFRAWIHFNNIQFPRNFPEQSTFWRRATSPYHGAPGATSRSPGGRSMGTTFNIA